MARRTATPRSAPRSTPPRSFQVPSSRSMREWVMPRSTRMPLASTPNWRPSCAPRRGRIDRHRDGPAWKMRGRDPPDRGGTRVWAILDISAGRCAGVTLVFLLALACSGTLAAGPSIEPANLPRIGTVDERFQSYNIEMVEVTGGRFWRPYQELPSPTPSGRDT